MWMAEISVDLIQMVYYHADSCAISPSAFLLKTETNFKISQGVSYFLGKFRFIRENIYFSFFAEHL